MLKVRQRPVKFPANASGGATLSYPSFSREDQDTRNGGGTWSADDPDDAYPDWPADQPWSQYQACVGGALRCWVSLPAGALAAYPRTGYTAVLNGTADDMLGAVAALRAAGWVDPDAARAVFVEWTAYLASRRLFCVATVLLEAEVGAVRPSAVVRLNALRLTSSAAAQAVEVRRGRPGGAGNGAGMCADAAEEGGGG
jgi:hypothetical protein